MTNPTTEVLKKVIGSINKINKRLDKIEAMLENLQKKGDK